MKHVVWSIIIVATFGIVLALVAGFAPRLESSAVTLNFGRYNTAPGPTIQVERPEDTPAKFAVRLGIGGAIGVLIGLASCKTIIRKFEKDFTPQ